MADALITEHGLADQGWGFRFDRAVKRLGSCDYRRRAITLSRVITAASEPEHVRQTLLHEVAHALVGHAAGHGAVWKRKARDIGYAGERCATNPLVENSIAEFVERTGLEDAPSDRGDYLRPGETGVLVGPKLEGQRVESPAGEPHTVQRQVGGRSHRIRTVLVLAPPESGRLMGTPGLVHEKQRGQSIDWLTPPQVFDALDETFDLDPCSPGAGKSFVPADDHFTIDDDGLSQAWGKHRFVWVNPPYGAQTAVWMRKLAEHGNGIALVFARTDVAWFHEIAPRASAICLVKGRIHFYQSSTDRPGGTPGAGSMLLAFGDRAGRAVTQSGLGLTFIPDR